MENLGALAILLAFCLAIYSIAASLVGAWKKKPFLVASGERASEFYSRCGFRDSKAMMTRVL